MLTSNDTVMRENESKKDLLLHLVFHTLVVCTQFSVGSEEGEREIAYHVSASPLNDRARTQCA
jgi:hypothetical protein